VRVVQPFRVFYPLAAADAVLVAGLWIAKLSAIASADVVGVPLAVWHRDELLYGMMPAVLAGFVLTASPRWTRHAPIKRSILLLLAVLWFAGRLMHVASGTNAIVQMLAQGMASAFVMALALMTAWQVIVEHAWRETVIALLLAGLAIAGVLPFLGAGNVADDTAWRLALACLLGLVTVIAGRVVPALTWAWLEARGERPAILSRSWIDTIAALWTWVALGALVVAPTLALTAVVSACAAVVHMARLARWKGWRVADSASIFALHIAYGWIPAGFALYATAIVWPSLASEAAAIHGFAIGGIGLMSVAVMASMMRRHSRTPFASSTLVSASLVLLMIAAPARIAAEIASNGRQFWLLVAATSWAGAFLLFLFAFYRQRRPRNCRK
jgi:uncharacterized protein involved in response to NO